MNNDIRQIITFLECWKGKGVELKYMDAKNNIFNYKSDNSVTMSNFDAASIFLNRSEFSKLKVKQLNDLFFIDYDLIPLLIQENYISSIKGASVKDLKNIADAADLISSGDIVNQKIRSNQEWSLLPQLSFQSCIYPMYLVAQYLPFPKFPEWLGKNSSTRKSYREIKELSQILGIHITGSRWSVKLDYSDALLQLILYKFKNSSVDELISTMEEYDITPDILKEHLSDIQYNPKKLDLFAGISTQQKTALTKQYNRLHKDSIGKKKSKKDNQEKTAKFDPKTGDVEETWEEEEEEEIEEEVIQKKDFEIQIKTKSKKDSKKDSKKNTKK